MARILTLSQEFWDKYHDKEFQEVRNNLLEGLEDIDNLNHTYLKILYGEEDVYKITEEYFHPNYNKGCLFIYGILDCLIMKLNQGEE
jgi:hypothetical protein